MRMAPSKQHVHITEGWLCAKRMPVMGCGCPRRAETCGVDVMKVDCEGGEVHLLEMGQKEICSVPFWIIETHSQELLNAISKKFISNEDKNKLFAFTKDLIAKYFDNLKENDYLATHNYRCLTRFEFCSEFQTKF